MRAGERRKFSRNMEFERSARKLAVVGFQFMGLIAPVALLVFAIAVIWSIYSGHDRSQILMAASVPAIPALGGALDQARALREERGKIHNQMVELINKGAGNWTSEDREKFDKMDADCTRMLGDVERLERLAASESEHRNRLPQDQLTPEQKASAEHEQKLAKAFKRYLTVGLGNDEPQRLGMQPLSAEERQIIQPLFGRMEVEKRDLGTGGGNALQGTGGGYFVPVGFMNKIEEALKYFGGMLQVSTIIPTDTGQPLPWPTDNDTTVMGEIVGENQPVSGGDVSIGSLTYGAYKFSTRIVRVSYEMLQDSAFDIETYLSGKFSTRLGRIFNNKFTVGTGTSEPKGIVVASTVGVSAGTTPAIVGDDNASSPSPSTEFGYIDLVNLEHSVDVAYRSGAKYMMNDKSIRFAKILKDKYGRPLWMPGMVTNQPDSINGYPYVVNNDMDAVATGKKSVLFGALDKYMIRRVKGLQIMRLSERYADYGQVAFLGFARADGNLLDAGTNPVKHLLNS